MIPIKLIAAKALNFISRNSTTIMTIMATSGVITASILSVDATRKACKEIEKEKIFRAKKCEEDGAPVESLNDIMLTKREVVGLCWKYYIPPAIVMLTSVGCIIGAQSVNERRKAVLAGLYSASEATLKEYKEKIVEAVGDKKAEEIQAAVNEEKIKKNPQTDKNTFVQNANTPIQGIKCYDPMTGRYFISTVDCIREAEASVNRDIISDDWVPLNTLYLHLGLGEVDLGNDVGWSTSLPLKIKLTSCLDESNTPCLAINYLNSPTPDRYY